MVYCDLVIQFLLGSVLGAPLIWYLISRWHKICSFYTVFFVVCETIVLVIGCINMHILVDGTRKFVQKTKHLDNTLTTDSEKIWYYFSLEQKLPTILIIIPIYKEEIHILERTLLAVDRISYPKELITIVVGDDGKNDETRDFLERKFSKIYYHRREKLFGNAKAGNINDILFANENENIRYNGEFVLILDCDMAPIPNILSNLLPLFYSSKFEKDEKCCFVQSPQEFCNIRGIDFLGQNYNFFYRVVLRAYSGYELGVPCCGTNVLFDRHHLTQIGGFQLGSITEDFYTSLILHSNGLHSKFYPYTTAIGFAPTTLVDFYNQRERWSIGGLQIVFQKSFWDKFKKLPIVYKWIYTFSGASPILSFFMCVLILGPVMDLLDPNIFQCGMSNFMYLIKFLPYSIVYVIYLLLLHRGLPWPIFFLSMQESIFMIPFFIRFFFTFIFRKLGVQEVTFKITPKTTLVNNSADYIIATLLILLPFFLYFSLVIFCILRSDLLHSIIQVDIGWIIFISLQLLNPILFSLQSVLFL